MNDHKLNLRLETLLIPVAMVFLIWLIFAVEIRYNYNFNFLGIYPRAAKGVFGILLSPLIHSNIEHLYSNTFPLLILSACLFYFYHKIALKILIYGILLSGLMTWLIGRPSYHIGASGLIYVLFSFIFFKGIIAKNYRLIALSLLVVFLYGSMIWYTIPLEKGISWEGHLSGFVIGLFLAFFYNEHIDKPKQFDWEKQTFIKKEDPFLKQFDDQGYFFEIEEEQLTENNEYDYFSQSNESVNYIFK